MIGFKRVRRIAILTAFSLSMVTMGIAATKSPASETTPTLTAPPKDADFNTRLKFRPRTGDRIAFFGDSITKQDLYTTFTEQYYLNFRPEMKLVFKNAGVGGDTLQKGMDRIDRDLVPFSPTVIVCFFGMNDGRYLRPFSNPGVPAAYMTYHDNYKKLIAMLREKFPKARLCLFTTTCVDDAAKHDQPGYNDVLALFSAYVQQLGNIEKIPVVDLYHPMLAAVARGRNAQPPYALIPDAVHPNAAGHYVMATTILKSWGELK